MNCSPELKQLRSFRSFLFSLVVLSIWQRPVVADDSAIKDGYYDVNFE